MEVNADCFIVEAPSGLRVRSSPDLQAPILGKIPDGGGVIVQQVVAYYADEIEGADNHWVHLRYENGDTILEGYSFGGYLRREPLDLEFMLSGRSTVLNAMGSRKIRVEQRKCAFTGTKTNWMFVHDGLDYVNGIQLSDTVTRVPMEHVLPQGHQLFTLQGTNGQTTGLIILYPNYELRYFEGERFYINDYERIPLIAAVHADRPTSIRKINVLARRVKPETIPEGFNELGDGDWKLITPFGARAEVSQ